MIGVGNGAVMLAILWAWSVLVRARRSIDGTTLVTAWYWNLLGLIAWTSTWWFDQCANAMSIPVSDHAWYACTVLSLCPPIAVLGSRRPGSRVWGWFVLVPMILVLIWPVMSLRLQGAELRGLQIEGPQVVAFCLVTIMGIGNYCGTRFTLPALMYGAAILAIVVSNSVVTPNWLADRSATRFWCSGVIVIAVGLFEMSPRRVAGADIDQLWFDFLDLFGIVWARRIQDRFNGIATKEGLPVQLELHGFVRCDASRAEVPPGNSADSQLRVEQILRWLLRRFVDPKWIDDRLKSGQLSTVPELPVDS